MMAWTARRRWTAYALAALATGAALLAAPPDGPPAEPVAPAARTPAPAALAEVPVLPHRPYAPAGRSPFGEAPAGGGAAGAAAAAAAAAEAAAAAAAVPPPPAAPVLPFAFLGRWTEHGVTTVLLSAGGRPLAAVEGQPLTAEYWVEHIGERELRLRHVPTGARLPLALVAGQATTPAAPGATAPAADTEEQN